MVMMVFHLQGVVVVLVALLSTGGTAALSPELGEDGADDDSRKDEAEPAQEDLPHAGVTGDHQEPLTPG